MKQARTIVSRWLHAHRLNPQRLLVLETVWERELGPLARHLFLAGISRETLFVRAGSPAAAQEFRLRQKELLRRIRKHFGEGQIQGLSLRKGWERT